MTRTTDTPTFHRFRCPRCDSTHFEHERSARSFAGFIAKHLSRCGKPQEPRHVTVEEALAQIETREVGALVVPEDWQRRSMARVLADKYDVSVSA